MDRRRLAVTLAAAGATLSAVMGAVMTVALVWPGRHETPAPPAGAGHDTAYKDDPGTRHRDETRARRREDETRGLPSPSTTPGDPATSPAPTRWEEARAAELLLADPVLGQRVRDAYARAAGRPPASAADLRVRSLVFRRHGCETRRCLQLFVWFPGGEQLDIGRIIVGMPEGSVHVLKW
ncbi:hypothetical protein AB0B89_04630 [Sphaerisporangium sp. NPDC049002]|uniref:hypothetical protein n=1 Tax=unclassified Sphaerisporangium TaxID=2630420 RepID=UPI0033C92668